MPSKFVFLSVWRALWLTLGIASLLWLAEFLGLTSVLTSQVVRSYLPIQRLVVTGVVGLKLQVFQMAEVWQAEKALVALRQDYNLLLTEVVELRAIKSENLALRKMLENTDRKLIKTIVTSPIISFAQPALGIGSEAGVTSGMMVISQNQLLGFVTEVKVGQSVVTLLQHSQTQPVLAETPSGVRGLVRGNGQQLWLLEVPPDQVVKEGEVVVTVGQAGVAPKLILGTITKIESNPVMATQKIRLTQPVSFYELSLVEVR